MLVVRVLLVVLLVHYLFGAEHASAQTASTACGGTSQPRCQVYAPADQATTDYTKTITDNITAWNEYSKSKMNEVTSSLFTWSFIPNIPTAACVNPKLDSPGKRSTVEMDICGPFNMFGKFINGVLAFFCVIGCVQQVRAAVAAK
jgi:hypothetical protein